MPDADENGVTIHTQFISNEENPSWMPSYGLPFTSSRVNEVGERIVHMDN